MLMQGELDRNDISSTSAVPDIDGPSTTFSKLQTFAAPAKNFLAGPLENQLEMERDQLALWIPVAVGTGIASWFMLADQVLWIALLAACGCVVIAAHLGIGQRRLGAAIYWFAVMVAIGCSVIWLRSEYVASEVLERPTVSIFYGRIEKVETLSSRDMVRLTLETSEKEELPPLVRVNVPLAKAKPGFLPGALVKLRARLMPPAIASLPGAYNFAERAWFMRLGATGQVLSDVEIIEPTADQWPFAHWRMQLSGHVQSQMRGGSGAIGATLATGDRGAIAEEDAEAMRASGLAHLLSISGLHVTAVVGATYLLVLKFLALSPALALRFRLPIVAAGAAAVAALAYTLLTGAQVPTIRACVAALLVLTALILGRSAITLRMVAAGALFVLILWPESLIGPSFQLSFAAVTAIIALHELPWMKKLIARREESVFRRIGRIILALFLTGLTVELALMPIALYHFHKAGVYGALANIIAIPLTTFVIMPLEALALLLDIVGLGAPIWWLCEQALASLLALAHFVSSRPGAITLLPTMPIGVFSITILGGLWLCLWRQKWRYFGFMPLLAGGLLIITNRAPDLYITGDGKHVGIRSEDGELAMLRTRSGDFVRDMLLENAGVQGETQLIDDWPGAECNTDSCSFTVERGGRDWNILATRSNHYISALELSAACRRADIVISERWLPGSCEPRWFKADRELLTQTGGMTVDLENIKVETVSERAGHHQWMRFKKQGE